MFISLSIYNRKPFLVNQEKDRLLLSRYLVESNELRFFELDTSLTNEVRLIQSYFKTLLDNYSL